MAARSFLALVADRRNAARLSIGLACGLRQGEALGQRWHYVNLDSGELRVWFQLQRLPWRHGCPDVAACTERWDRRPCPRRRPNSLPKSGRPQVCIPELVTVLKAHREVQDLEREAAANLWQDHDVVFARKDGLLIDLQRICASGQPSAQAAIPTRARTQCGTRLPPSPWTRASPWPSFRRCWATPVSGSPAPTRTSRHCSLRRPRPDSGRLCSGKLLPKLLRRTMIHKR